MFVKKIYKNILANELANGQIEWMLCAVCYVCVTSEKGVAIMIISPIMIGYYLTSHNWMWIVQAPPVFFYF